MILSYPLIARFIETPNLNKCIVLQIVESYAECAAEAMGLMKNQRDYCKKLNFYCHNRLSSHSDSCFELIRSYFVRFLLPAKRIATSNDTHLIYQCLSLWILFFC